MSQSKVLNFPPLSQKREHYVAVFSRYLRSQFKNPEQVAAAFDVRFQTALNWWNGDNCPGGVPIMKAMHCDTFVAMVRGAA